MGARIYSFNYDRFGLFITIERLVDARERLSAEMMVSEYSPGSSGRSRRHLAHERFNLLSSRTAKSVAKMLKGKWDREDVDVDWERIIEQVTMGVIQRHREGEKVIRTADIKISESADWRIEPILREKTPTLIYGFGGSGKSYLACYLSFMVAEGYPDVDLFGGVEPGNVLYLDYESSEQEHAIRMRSIHRGWDLEKGSDVFYRRCAAKLAYDIHDVQKQCLENKIDLVVVDSAGPACGGEPNDEAQVIQMFTALRSLDVSSVIIAHKSKMRTSQGPYGSVYWWNYPRNVYRVKHEQVEAESETHIGLFHEKSNIGRKQQPLGIRIAFFDGGDQVRFFREDPATMPGIQQSLSLKDQIAELLKNGALQVRDIAEELDSPPNSVRAVLSRSKDAFQRVRKGVYGLKSQEML